jgi:hypothetical protein
MSPTPQIVADNLDIASRSGYDNGFMDCYTGVRFAIMGHFQTGNVPLEELERITDEILIHVAPRKEKP